MRFDYPAEYSDAFGRESVRLTSDGAVLRLELRGFAFEGSSFDVLWPVAVEAGTAVFSLHQGCLVDFALEFEVPMPIDRHGGSELCLLFVRVEVTQESEVVSLRLQLDDLYYASSGRTGGFEDELLSLMRVLPPGVRLRSCFTCAYSDYSPSGGHMFGGMTCYRDNREAYLQVRTKHDYLTLGGGLPTHELWLCGEFEPRVPGTGYRG